MIMPIRTYNRWIFETIFPPNINNVPPNNPPDPVQIPTNPIIAVESGKFLELPTAVG